MSTPTFEDLSLDQGLLRALAREGYTEPTPIQREAIPVALAGTDLLATAQTGTGKTAAFTLPILQMLSGSEPAKRGALRALILTPTRELALQIDQSLRAYGRHLPLKSAVVLGGVSSFSQVRALRQRPEILVATPGRLLDLIGQGHVRLDNIEFLVLDEADRMLDMGFIHDVKKIVGFTPKERQTMLFSATMSKAVSDLAASMLRYPARIQVDPVSSVANNITQRVLFVSMANKRALLADVLKNQPVQRALVFTRTKHGADRIAKHLSREGISSDAIHSNKTQAARQRALAAFDRNRIQVLVATDIVARGIDVDGISHVINFELPNDPESYVHRIGRTARAGAEGVALTFCDSQEVSMLRGIERLTSSPLTVMEDHPFHCPATAAMRSSPAPSRGNRPSRQRPRRGGGPRPNARRGRPRARTR